MRLMLQKRNGPIDKERKTERDRPIGKEKEREVDKQQKTETTDRDSEQITKSAHIHRHTQTLEESQKTHDSSVNVPHQCIYLDFRVSVCTAENPNKA